MWLNLDLLRARSLYDPNVMSIDNNCSYGGWSGLRKPNENVHEACAFPRAPQYPYLALRQSCGPMRLNIYE